MKKAVFACLFFMICGYVQSFAQSYPIVFVSRSLEHNGNIFYNQAGLLPGMGGFSRFKVTGGSLMIRQTNGAILTLTDSTRTINGIRLLDVQQPNVHWDGNKIVFAGIESRDSSWRIYEIRKDGSDLKKITFSNRNIDLSQFGEAASKFQKYDDIDPCYLPDGRILFASTRYPTLSEIGGLPVTNLFATDTLGIGKNYRLTTERNSGEKPTIDPTTGYIIYSRWWVNIDRPSNIDPSGHTRIDSLALTTDIGNIWQANIIRADGDQLKFYSGDPRQRKTMQAYRSRILSDGSMLSVYNPVTSLFTTAGSPGIRIYPQGISEYAFLSGVDTATTLYPSSPPASGTYMPPYATDPVELPDGRIMFSLANSVIDQDYGIYIMNRTGGAITPLYDIPGKLELNAEVLLPKKTPPVINGVMDYDTNMVPPTTDPVSFYQGGLFRFDCMNVFSNAAVDVPIDDAPKIIKKGKFRFNVNFQRQDPDGKDYPILFREIDLDYDGKIAQGDIPANISLFEQIVDSTGKLLINSKGNIAHVPGMNFGVNGTGTKCVGCHAGHSLIPVPPNVTLGQYTNLSTSASVTASSILNNDPSYKAQNFVDRKARNTDLRVNWISNGGINQFAELKWEIPIEAKEIRLYNVFPNALTNTDILVNDCEIFFYFDEIQMGHIASTGPLRTNGTSLILNPLLTFNRMRVLVKSFTGKVNNISVAALAEVETIARVSVLNFVGVSDNNSTVNSYRLEQNYPNPFNPVTKITFYLPKTGNARLEVFDVSGKLVSTLIDRKLGAGEISLEFNASNLASGIYFYRLSSGSFVASKKMLLIK
ncbi:hypothetical protein BH10BAC5_BH10BAC5_00430 [soil metagenome]